MRRIMLLAVLALALPMAAFASSSVDFSNSGGTLTGTSAGLSLTGSTLIGVNGLNGNGLVTGNLGTMSFSTGALTSGSLQFHHHRKWQRRTQRRYLQRQLQQPRVLDEVCSSQWHA